MQDLYVLVGVMVDLKPHCFPPAIISGEGGATLERVSPFLMTPVVFQVQLYGPHMELT